jgi:hypothetical protein
MNDYDLFPGLLSDAQSLQSVEQIFQPSNKENQLAELLSKLPKNERQDFLSNLIKNLRISGEYSKIGNDYVNVDQFGGRIGYSLPLDKSTLDFGMVGGGQTVETPVGTFKDRQVTGGDVSYKFGPNTLSAAYDKYGMLPSQMTQPLPGESALENFFRILYRREF